MYHRFLYENHPKRILRLTIFLHQCPYYMPLPFPLKKEIAFSSTLNRNYCLVLAKLWHYYQKFRVMRKVVILKCLFHRVSTNPAYTPPLLSTRDRLFLLGISYLPCITNADKK